jgi:hypothetical protein
MPANHGLCISYHSNNLEFSPHYWKYWQLQWCAEFRIRLRFLGKFWAPSLVTDCVSSSSHKLANLYIFRISGTSLVQIRSYLAPDFNSQQTIRWSNTKPIRESLRFCCVTCAAQYLWCSYLHTPANCVFWYQTCLLKVQYAALCIELSCWRTDGWIHEHVPHAFQSSLEKSFPHQSNPRLLLTGYSELFYDGSCSARLYLVFLLKLFT